MGAGLLWGACLFFHPRKNPRTGNDPRRSQTGRQCCRIYLPSKNKQEGLSDGLNETGMRGPGQRLTVERVAQVDLVPQRVAQLDSDKLAVPRPLHVLFAVTVRVRVCGEGELGPNGIFPCRDGEAQHAAVKLLARTAFIHPYRRRSRSPADRLNTEKTRTAESNSSILRNLSRLGLDWEAAERDRTWFCVERHGFTLGADPQLVLGLHRKLVAVKNRWDE